MGRARGEKRWPPELRDLQRRGGMSPDWHEAWHGQREQFPRSRSLCQLAAEGSSQFPREYVSFEPRSLTVREDPLVREWIEASSLWAWSERELDFLQESFAGSPATSFWPLKYFLEKQSLLEIEDALLRTIDSLDPEVSSELIEESVLAMYEAGRKELLARFLSSSYQIAPLVRFGYESWARGREDQAERQARLLGDKNMYLPRGSFDPRSDPRKHLLRRLENFAFAEARLSAATIYTLLGASVPDRNDLLRAIHEDAASRFQGVSARTVFASLRDHFTDTEWNQFLKSVGDFSKRAAPLLLRTGRYYNEGNGLGSALLQAAGEDKSLFWEDFSEADRLRLADLPGS